MLARRDCAIVRLFNHRGEDWTNRFPHIAEAVGMLPIRSCTIDGEVVGVSTWIGYTANEGKMLTLAVLDAEHAEPGEEVVLTWGEPDGGTLKTTVDRPEKQISVRAIVSPVPYSEPARLTYHEGWRTATRG